MTHRPEKLLSALSGPRLGLLVGLPVLGVAVTADAWGDILHVANRDTECAHIFLVPLVVTWLIWVRRWRLKHCRLRGTLVGSAVLAAGAVLYGLGDRFLFHVFWHAGAILVLLGCLVSVLGSDVLWNFRPAAVAFLFAVPVPGSLRQYVAIPMERATAAATEQVYQVLGLSIERSGNELSVHGQEVAIEEACNGLRMVIALSMVSYAFAFASPLRWYVRGIVILLSPVSAIVCNVVRLIPTVYLYGYYPKALADAFHDASGWVMLIVSFLVLLASLRVLRWAMVPVNRYVLAYD